MRKLLFLIVLFLSVYTAAQGFEVDDYTVDIVINKDASFEVTEW